MTIQQHKSQKWSIEVTAEARAHIVKQLHQQNALGLRVFIKKDGCSGLRYQIDYAREHLPEDEKIVIDNDLSIFIPRDSYIYLNGTTIRLLTEGLNQKIVFDNPNAENPCGCGESFNVQSN